MDKILIKPTAKEIILRGKPEDGHVDAFSYNYEGSNGNSLGSLFIVGQVYPANEDTSYMINLVASLAKREYYIQPDSSPKEAFSKTLKKINEVLQDFFRNKDLAVNIGIFTIAGENIFISRLGKFKIFLARDGQNVDILNNITLFNKEHIQEKEFSNIISGKVNDEDKIFAFYPGRPLVSREKNIKANLLGFGSNEFAEKIQEIKKGNENFFCAGVHITVNKVKEPAVINTPQPQELRNQEPSFSPPKAAPKTVLAKITKISQPETTTDQDLPSVRPNPVKLDSDKKTKPTIIDNASRPETLERSNVYYPDNQSLSVEKPLVNKAPAPVEPSPLIRPTEFSSAKKDNFFDVILKKFKPSGVYIIGAGAGRNFSKKKIIIAGSVVAVIVLAVAAKMTLITNLPIPVPGLETEKEKLTNALTEDVKVKIQSAESYRSQNNLFEARRVLLESIAALASSDVKDSEEIQQVKSEVLAVLDQIDKAVDSSPSLLYQISQELGQGSVVGVVKDKILVYTSSLTETDSGNVIKSNETGIENTVPVKNFDPLYITGADEIILIISKLADKVGSLTIKESGLKVSSLLFEGSALNLYPYQDNLYILTSDGLYKVVDAAKGKNTAAAWLNKDAKLPTNPVALAVDGKVFVITKDGVLATYYKGDKVSEVSTGIPADLKSNLFTTTDSSNLYLFNKSLGRIYVIAKENGSLVKTLKISSDQSLVSASISENGIIYLLSQDNKIWKIQP